MKQLESIINILENTKRILILTGAGMSADSGIPTFRDEDGFWKGFSEHTVNFKNLANGHNMLKNPEKIWGFYEWRRRNCQKNKPHEGYFIINKILKKFEGFIKTTNTDGYHLRSGLSKDKIFEVHGSIWKLQCLDGYEKYTIENYDIPLCDLDEKTMLVNINSIPKYKGKLLRPNILMFDDSYYIQNNNQIEKFNNFSEEEIDTIFLIGCDVGVPTNVLTAQRYKKKIESKIICINPNPDCCGKILIPDIYVNSTAKNALQEIENNYDLS